MLMCVTSLEPSVSMYGTYVEEGGGPSEPRSPQLRAIEACHSVTQLVALVRYENLHSPQNIITRRIEKHVGFVPYLGFPKN